MLGKAWGRWTMLPGSMQVGIVLLVSGGLVDIAYHVSFHAAASNDHAVAAFGHFITLTGMVVTMLGLVSFARKRSRRSTHKLKGVMR